MDNRNMHRTATYEEGHPHGCPSQAHLCPQGHGYVSLSALS